MLNYNLTAPYLAMRAVAPIMQRQGQGRIVNITSIAAFRPAGSSIAYSVSKAALVHLTKCMAVALAPSVLVNSVAPGTMLGTRVTGRLAPDFLEADLQSSALQRSVDKDDVTGAVLTFVKTDSITGQNLVVDCGKVYH